MSGYSQDNSPIDPLIVETFQSQDLNGLRVAENSKLTTLIKRDSNDFAAQLIKHPRGMEIVCDLVNIALRPEKSFSVEVNQQKESEVISSNVATEASSIAEKQQQQSEEKTHSEHYQSTPKEATMQIQEKNPKKDESKSPYITKESATTVTYNALQILTNQYDEFVQFVLGESEQQEQNDNKNRQSKNLQEKKYQLPRYDCNDQFASQSDQEDEDVFAPQKSYIRMSIGEDSVESVCEFLPKASSSQTGKSAAERDSTSSLNEEWEDNVLKNPNFVENYGMKNSSLPISLSENNKPTPPKAGQQEGVLLKSKSLEKSSLSGEKLSNRPKKRNILDTMFLLFEEAVPIQETPISYFNKIILQFLYQKPEEIMKFFYDGISPLSKNRKVKKDSKKGEKIRTIAKHMYNNSVTDLIVHILQIENQGNFYPQQKISILKVIAEQVFHIEGDRNMGQEQKNALSKPTQQTVLEQVNQKMVKTFSTQYLKSEKVDQNGSKQNITVSELIESKVENYVSVLKSISEKLEDRYEQQKYLPILKAHLNNSHLMKGQIQYFFKNFNYFDMEGLLCLLAQILKSDQVNFRLSKITAQSSNPFGKKDFSFHNKNEESSINLYDLKLSKEIMDSVEEAMVQITESFTKWESDSNTMRIIEYYDLVYSWLNVKFASSSLNEHKSSEKSPSQLKSDEVHGFVKNFEEAVVSVQESSAGLGLFSSSFINMCVCKMESHPSSTILHNLIKNILVDFLPKVPDVLCNLILKPHCCLLAFLERQMDEIEEASRRLQKRKDEQKVVERTPDMKASALSSTRKCYQSQVFHIAKCLISLWDERSMLGVIKKTEDDDEVEFDSINNVSPRSPTGDPETLIQFQNLKRIVSIQQQFYDKLICGDPRKIGEYQEEQSSEIIMSGPSSFKNFFNKNILPSKSNNILGSFANGNFGDNDDQLQHSSEEQLEQEEVCVYMAADKKEESQKDEVIGQRCPDPKSQSQPKVSNRYGGAHEFQSEGSGNKKSPKKNLKLNVDSGSLKIPSQDSKSLFQSVISPLNANRSHTFNFDFDALPLDSDKSDEVSSEEDDDLVVSEENGKKKQQSQKLKETKVANEKADNKNLPSDEKAFLTQQIERKGKNGQNKALCKEENRSKSKQSELQQKTNKNNGMKSSPSREEQIINLMSQNIENLELPSGGHVRELEIESTSNILSSSNQEQEEDSCENGLHINSSSIEKGLMNLSQQEKESRQRSHESSKKNDNSSYKNVEDGSKERNLLTSSVDNYRREDRAKSINLIEGQESSGSGLQIDLELDSRKDLEAGKSVLTGDKRDVLNESSEGRVVIGDVDSEEEQVVVSGIQVDDLSGDPKQVNEQEEDKSSAEWLYSSTHQFSSYLSYDFDELMSDISEGKAKEKL